MLDPAIISIISATTALVASVTGPLVTLYIGRAQIRAAVRSGNRQKWIEEFRDLIATFCGQVAASTQLREKVFKDGRVSIPAEPEMLHHFERLIYTATKIRLMVNPLDREHLLLVDAIDELLMRFRTAAEGDDLQNDAQAGARKIIGMSLALIRREWQRVQRGA